MSAERPHALVLGAGLAGLTVARQLARNGFRVTLLEKSRLAGGKAGSREALSGRDGQPVPGRARTAANPYAVEGSWPAFTAYWDRVQPGETVHARFRLNFDDCGTAGNTPFVVGGTVTGATSAGTLTAAAIPPRALRCPPPEGSGATNNPCE